MIFSAKKKQGSCVSCGTRIQRAEAYWPRDIRSEGGKHSRESWCLNCAKAFEKQRHHSTDVRCSRCRLPAKIGSTFCEVHLVERRSYQRNWRSARNKTEKCMKCKSPRASGRKYCEFHLMKTRNYQREIRKKVSRLAGIFPGDNPGQA